MDDFACIEDWDLEAVVRGCNNYDYEGSPNSMEENPSLSFFAPLNLQQDDPIFCFPSIFGTTSVFDELEELYKPFYPVLPPSLSPQTTTSMSVIPQEIKEPAEPEPEKLQSGSPIISSSPNTTPLASTHASKYKRSKKNQHKRMVMQVTASGLSSDMWAWRKYGQKPIKGSPYPRSYYRCSSSKGCLARKQVERSCSDPGVFIITYTAEHSHAHPTRRNSLAGSTRNKLSSLPKKPTSSSESNMASDNNNCCPNSSSNSAVLSPTSPLMAASIEGEFMQHGRMQESIKKEEEQILPNIILREQDDFIPSLDDLDGLVSELTFDGCFSDQFPDMYHSKLDLVQEEFPTIC